MAWDRVCIFGPYSPDDKVEAVTGIHGAGERAYDIRSNDGINVLMFIDGGHIAASVAHPRGRGDFGPEVVRKCYSREQAERYSDISARTTNLGTRNLGTLELWN